ncbi:cysteine desulfurase family protein [Paenisporosarcina sp. OV554]|uniref:cysteine desulfurase family protein n=1 Tax=Paenisporosarcina sp. OV554 TaxID=2135694 RepID=UPI000D398C80|nr:cysteine desulfurase family protein [Paenisporosarcina sp. OV554]PUB15200.1 cysteine desulfurase [Paenisporosarcina sp. OV554]
MYYFDHSATTKPHKEVLETFIKVNEEFYANPASIHELGVEVNTLLSRARKQVADMLGTDETRVIFTSGGTESNHFAIQGVAKNLNSRGKHIITSSIEHPSVLEAMKQLERQGFEVEILPVNEKGLISVDEVKACLRKDTILVSIMHINNELGSIQPIKELANMIHQYSRAVFHVDAIQSFGKYPVSFDKLGVDVLTLSAHKFNGLKGSGIVAWKGHVSFEPVIVGGGQEFGLRSGTVPVAQAVSFAKAMRLAFENQSHMLSKYIQWNEKLRSSFRGYRNVRILSADEAAAHILTISVRHLKGEVLVNALQAKEIIVSTSSACSSKQTKTSHVIESIGLPDDYIRGVIRISLGTSNTDQQIDYFTENFSTIMKQVKGE